MNMDDLMDKVEDNPIKFFVGMWLIGATILLVGLAIALLIIFGFLSLFGVI